MKRIVLIKDHFSAKKGTGSKITNGRADYLIRMGIAREVAENGEKKAPSKPKVKIGKK